MHATYNVTVKHPTGYHSGTHTLRVCLATGRIGLVYLSGAGFGCSRDYPGTIDDCLTAIRTFMAEHGCTVVKCERVS